MPLLSQETLVALTVHAWLYGINCFLFALATHLLWKRKTAGYELHLFIMLILFVLASLCFAAPAAALILVDDVVGPERSFYVTSMALPITVMAKAGGKRGALNVLLRIAFVFSNLVADLYFTYRCYVVWGCSKKIIILPSILICISLFFQTVPLQSASSDVSLTAYGSLVSTFITNVTLTALTAGRIWYIGHKARGLLKKAVQSKYTRTIQIILESGLLYPFVLFIVFIKNLQQTMTSQPVAMDASIAAKVTIVTIAPTLIIVRVSLGVAAKDDSATQETFKARKADEEFGVLNTSRSSGSGSSTKPSFV